MSGLPQLPAPVDGRHRCQCSRMSVPCSSRMTQEDLRCDTCRDGCGMAIGIEGFRTVAARHLPPAQAWPVEWKRAAR